MQHLITQLSEVGTGKSRSPTSNILLKKYGHEKLCNWELCVEFWGQNFYRHSANL